MLAIPDESSVIDIESTPLSLIPVVMESKALVCEMAPTYFERKPHDVRV